ncbi:MAG: Glu-tRNA(Gln) amidotransferase subunit GatD [Candidatus Methanospirare jalkutatii]|nr:MAG: Glu-tRNA(Gln) amidotransferase subunit GatD [Candidatus Methanospirare jalkutatii]UYZ40295.1 MAG: Glu-tRNA(Gln) amidotransferase subunit GatD [Candidatus Methanospirare jalkutatii]
MRGKRDRLEFQEGDRVRVRKKTAFGEVCYEGIVMPSYTKSLVLKLESGYNIGIRTENAEIEVLERGGVKDKGRGVSEREEASISEEVGEREQSEDAEERHKPRGELPKVSILSTGGTIASKVDYRTGAVSPQFSTADILEAIPELAEIADIRGKVIFSILSENMRPAFWRKLAREVFEEIKKGAEGVVVTHGTDTMGYSAAALSFMLKTPIPVVFVGSQRSADRPSSDAAMNAICATKAATSNLGEVAVVMHGSTSDDFCDIHRGTRVRKMHTSARYAFVSVNAEPIGRVFYHRNPRNVRVELFNATLRGERPLELCEKLEERCALIKFYPGEDPAVFDFFVENGYKGIVVEGTGLGHVSADWIPHIARATKDGIPVVMTSQCLFGSVCLRVYDTGRDLLKAGVIEGGDMLPETALVKLMWVLAQTSDYEEVRELMQKNIAGELGERRTVHHALCNEIYA